MKLLPRSAWTSSRPPGGPIPTPVARLVLHHSVTADPGAVEGAQLIDRIHKQRFGASSGAGYNWAYSPSERTFVELRGPGVSGAHTLGYNSTAHAVCVLGNFERDVPPGHVADDLAAFAVWHARYGPGRFTHGHRDLGPSACPGRHLYPLIGDINRAAAGTSAAPSPDDLEVWYMALTPQRRATLDWLLDDVNVDALTDLLGRLGASDRQWLGDMVTAARLVDDRGARVGTRVGALGGLNVDALVDLVSQLTVSDREALGEFITALRLETGDVGDAARTLARATDR